MASNSLIKWMLERPGERLFGSLILPVLLFSALVATLLYSPSTESDSVLVDPRTGTVVSEKIFDSAGKEITQRRTLVTYWEKWSGFEGEAIKDAVDAFNRKHDKVFVKLVILGGITQKTRTATAGGDPPDLAGLYSFDVPVFAAQNALIPLDEMLAKAGISANDYVPAFWRLGVFNGKTWAVPTAPSTLALHWNKKLFREAGLDPDRPPRTIAELDEFTRKLTKRDADGHLTQIGFMQTEPGWWKYAWCFWFGGQLWDGKNITANPPQNLAALRWVKSYVDEYGASELARFKNTFGGFSSADNAFFRGKVAMELQGVWMCRFVEKYAPKDFEWGVAPFPPAVPGAENLTIAEADVLGIPRGAKPPEAAFEFIKFMATPEGMEILCRGHGKNSPLRNHSPDWLSTHPNPNVRVFMDLAENPNCQRTPPLGIWLEYKQAWDAAFDEVWNARKSPEEALDELQSLMQRRLDESR